MDFASSTRVAENRTRWKGIVGKLICGAPTTFQEYGIENRSRKVNSREQILQTYHSTGNEMSYCPMTQ